MLVSYVFPLTFVVLWASAFATGSVATQDATPFAALAFRFAIVAVGFFGVAWVLSEFSKINRRDLKHSVITGLLFHGLYLGGCWYSFSVDTSWRIGADSLHPTNTDRDSCRISVG